MEVCVDSIESALNAASGGAARLELCSGLNDGGLTPTTGLLHTIKTLVNIPVFVMIRIHSCSDFVYSEREVEAMLYDAQSLKATGADGFVFGALTPSGDIDITVCERFVKVVYPRPVTFHRAFDVTRDPFTALELIITAGFSRILTSGQEVTADNGISLIKSLISRAMGRIIIMPGAGITKHNVGEILMSTGAKEFHGSGKILTKRLTHSKQKIVQMGLGNDSASITSSDNVREMVAIAHAVSMK